MVDVEDAKQRQLVEALVEHQSVEAAAVIDENGNVRCVEGTAAVFKEGTSVEAGTGGVVTGEASEDVYLESLEDDYLIVVFESRKDFEPIKQEVEELRERLEV